MPGKLGDVRTECGPCHLGVGGVMPIVLVAWSYPTLCDPMDCSPPGSSVHRISQARILEWVAVNLLWGSSWPKDWTWVSHVAGRSFTSHKGTGHEASVPVNRALWLRTMQKKSLWQRLRKVITQRCTLKELLGLPCWPSGWVSAPSAGAQVQFLVRRLDPTCFSEDWRFCMLRPSNSVIKSTTGFPWWYSGWESAFHCRGHRFDLWSMKILHAAEQLSPCTTTTEPSVL